MATSSKIGVWNRALIEAGQTQFIQSETDQNPETEICNLRYDDILKEALTARDWKWATFIKPLTQIDSQSTPYTGDAAETVFAVPHAYLDPADVVVTVDEVEQESGTDYVLTGPDGAVAAFVTFTVAPGASTDVLITVNASREGYEHLYAVPTDFLKDVGLLVDGERLIRTPNSLRQEYRIFPSATGEGLVLATDLDTDDFDGLEYVSRMEHVPLWPAEFLNAIVYKLAAALAAGLVKDRRLAKDLNAAYDDCLSKAFALDQDSDKTYFTAPSPSEVARGSYDGTRTTDPFRSR